MAWKVGARDATRGRRASRRRFRETCVASSRPRAHLVASRVEVVAGGSRDPVAEHGATRATRVGVEPRWRGRQRRAVQRVHHARERRAVRVGRMARHHRRRGGRSRARRRRRARRNARRFLGRSRARRARSASSTRSLRASASGGHLDPSAVVPLPRHAVPERRKRTSGARGDQRPSAGAGDAGPSRVGAI